MPGSFCNCGRGAVGEKAERMRSGRGGIGLAGLGKTGDAFVASE
jgi:hypothetical protein